MCSRINDCGVWFSPPFFSFKSNKAMNTNYFTPALEFVVELLIQKCFKEAIDFNHQYKWAPHSTNITGTSCF